MKNTATVRLSDDVELTHRRLLSPAVLIEPLPAGCGGEDGAVLAAPPIWLMGDFCLPVFEAHIRARLVNPLAIGNYIINSQPDVLIGADALAHVAVELVVLVPCQRSAQAASFGEAVVTGIVERFLHWIGQETLAMDLGAFQTN